MNWGPYINLAGRSVLAFLRQWVVQSGRSVRGGGSVRQLSLLVPSTWGYRRVYRFAESTRTGSLHCEIDIPFPHALAPLGRCHQCSLSAEWLVDTRVGFCKFKLYVHLIRAPQVLGVYWVSLFTQYLLRADMCRALGCDPGDIKQCKGVYRDSWTVICTYHIFYSSKNLEMA